MNNLEIKKYISNLGLELSFNNVRISDPDLFKYEEGFKNWISNEYYGSMDYMVSHGLKRMRPKEIMPNVKSIISVSLNYFPENTGTKEVYNNSEIAYISRYALGRDYHKVVKNKLKIIANNLGDLIPDLEYRIFVDSAPVYERGFAEKSGIGWTGKNSLILTENNGSFFFLGQIFINTEIEPDESVKNNCGKCKACIKYCPTSAILEDGLIDARKCISYLTIENKESIPIEFRHLMKNRIYGCDDCQLICPYNKEIHFTAEKDFAPRSLLLNKPLIELWRWDEAEFLKNTEGSAIRRIGYERWTRNLAVAIGNSELSDEKISLLKSKLGKISEIVDEHINWAIEQFTS